MCVMCGACDCDDRNGCMKQLAGTVIFILEVLLAFGFLKGVPSVFERALNKDDDYVLLMNGSCAWWVSGLSLFNHLKPW